MQLRAPGYAAAAGLASFVVVFAAVSGFLVPYVEFSVLVGLPAGLVVGAVVAAFVLLQLGRGTGRTRRRVALGLGTFGVVHLLAFGVATAGLRLGATPSLLAATALGLAAGAAAAVTDEG